MTIRHRLLASALLLPAAAPLAAQDEVTLPEEALEADSMVEEFPEEIIVTGRGLNAALSTGIYATTTLERDVIVASPSGRIEDVLRGVAGFQQFRRSDSRSSNPSAQGVTLRALGGNATSRALVLLDGVPLADPFFGYIPLSAIAPETLGQVRVTRGGGSGPFGAGALAGTIELESAGPDTIAPVLANAAINDRGETELSGVLTQSLGRGFATASGRWDRGQGFFTTPQDQRVPATARAAFESWNAALRAAAPLTDTVEVQARIATFRDARTLRFEGADSTSAGEEASIRFVGRGDWAFDALAYVQTRDFSNIVISSTRFTPTLDQRRTPSTGIGGKFELRPPILEGHDIRIGADFRRADGELQEEAINAVSGAITERRRAGGSTSNLGIFLEDDWQIGPLLINGGLRADRSSITDGFYRAVSANGVPVSTLTAPGRSDWTVSWRAGASFNATRRLDLRAAAYTGLRLPTLNELYRPFVVFPVVTEANAALENERLEGFEVGFDWQPVNALVISVTAFDNEVENAIANVTIAPNLRRRENLPAIAARGIEANVAARFGAVSVEGALAWTDAAVRGEGTSLDLDGNRPAQTPELAGSLTLGWEPAAGWRIAGTLRHVSAQFEDDRETDRLAPATTIDAFVAAPLGKGVSLIVRGENLTDEDIVTRNQGGSIDLGVPRTFWLGLRYGF
ncbi:outer membrane receptor protein involved in Fe transport [Erythromicrobium ramosum]|uniref:Outer membrane receptor protein involved in Fe transport n=1 Tax=Erythrobacter ramosus TaxID=35811 RepID=A0A6I4UJP7_9SPHN|nr:TonB-dependent receptor [Erythrobacter ramosus]MBB3774309.1 outer membrane receptor protein involved in Fe transport [Erythrobacter ramosus]MXP38034.1 TonB-dependent receptor [Erythrobacter ramosus]